MIAYADVAFTAYIKSLFPDYTVVFAPPEAARTSLSNAGIAKNEDKNLPNPNNSVGIPGLAVWRTGTVERTDMSNLPQGFNGWHMGRFPSGAVDPDVHSRTITLSGTLTTGNVINLITTLSGVAHTISYTVQTSDTTLAKLAEHLETAINSNDVTKDRVTAAALGTVLTVTTPVDSSASFSYTKGSNTEILTISAAALQSLAGEHNYTLARHVKIQYVVTAYAKKHVERDHIERTMWFSDIYKAVDVTIPTGTDTIEPSTFSWPVLREGGPISLYEVNSDTGRIVWYKTTLRYNVFCIWAKSTNIPPIETIMVSYEQLMDGEEFLLDQISFTATDPIQ